MLYEQWKMLPGKYIHKIQPDAGRFVDATEAHQAAVADYNQFRKDPLIAAAELTRTVLTRSGYDAGKLVPKDSTEEKPEPPKTSFSLSLDKATPVTIEMAITMLEQDGYVFSAALKQALLLQGALNEEMAMMEQEQKAQNQSPEHGGPAQKTERIDKRASERTGGLEGVGRVS